MEYFLKKLIVILSAFLTMNAFAAEKMSEEAVEMFQVLSHHQVVDCMRNVQKMVNVSSEKTVARCPGCNTYVVSGNELGIDTPRAKKTVITIKGRAVPGTFRGFIQTYTCDIQE
jgi:hypothetical protein